MAYPCIMPGQASCERLNQGRNWPAAHLAHGTEGSPPAHSARLVAQSYIDLVE